MRAPATSSPARRVNVNRCSKGTPRTRLHPSVVELAVPDRERLVESGERVACRAGGVARYEIDGIGVGFDALAGEESARWPPAPRGRGA